MGSQRTVSATTTFRTYTAWCIFKSGHCALRVALLHKCETGGGRIARVPGTDKRCHVTSPQLLAGYGRR
jgi:hypothetical protein